MTFKLLYEGRLPSAGSPKDKQAIRRQLHPQLVELSRQAPLSGSSIVDWIDVERGKFKFRPIVTTWRKLICHLDILFLRPGEPGSLITHGGDIDNRLKTLFDSLQVPDPHQVTDDGPADGETPFFCLMEDDALITRVAVDTDRLLTPDISCVGAPRVHLVIAVTLRATQSAWNNIGLVG